MRGRRHARHNSSPARPAVTSARPAQRMASGSSGHTGRNENAEFIVWTSPSLLQQRARPAARSARFAADGTHAHGPLPPRAWVHSGETNANEHGVTEPAVHGLDDASGSNATRERDWPDTANDVAARRLESRLASAVPLRRSPSERRDAGRSAIVPHSHVPDENSKSMILMM
ncbi:hypothetical protein BURKHO8Y_240139 [Burkholderia sp. 8Y]|nr:hypothetical protein BURKHO8Y_240139 [Burkholderia sp. 8Y]